MHLTEKKLIFLTVLAGAFVLAVMILIFYFSSCSADESSAQSGFFTNSFIKIFIPDFDKRTDSEQDKIIENLTVLIRKTAHFTEFMLLGIAVCIFLLLIKKKLYIAFAFSVLYAVSDEIHQIYTVGRGPGVVDILIDSLGAAFGIGLVCLFVFFRKRELKNESGKKNIES